MKKVLLLAALAAASLPMAANNFYANTLMGEARSVSPQGKYALFCDPDNLITYLWDATKPTEFTVIEGLDGRKFDGYAVNDDCTIVGSLEMHPGDGRVYYQPVAWDNGTFVALPLDPQAGNQNYPVAISANGKIVGGYQGCRPSVPSMGYPAYPTIWEKQDDGTWKTHTYNDIQLPDHQGFWVRTMYTDGTLEGTVLGGILNCAAGSMVPALLQHGQLVFWNTLEVRQLEEEFRGKPVIWEYDFIDGFCDGWQKEYFFQGGFYGSDTSGNFYGLRTRTKGEMPEDGHGEIEMGACVYNVITDEWEHIIGRPAYSTGLHNELFFDANGKVWKDGQSHSIADFFNVNTSGYNIAGITHTSNEGNVVIGQHNVFNEATSQFDPFPFVIALDQPLTGVDEIAPAQAVSIRGMQGAIEVTGAEQVAVFDMQGRSVGTTGLAAGIYVVKADNTTAKVVVK